MKRPELFERLGLEDPGGPDFEVASVTEDSRRAGKGTLFVAVRGEKSDGHDWAAAAAAQGAAAVLGDRAGIAEYAGLPYIYYDHPRKAAGLIAHGLAGDPSRALAVAGVTGTNGKTSTVLLTRAILNHAGYKAAAFGTLGYETGAETLAAPHTTPFGEDLARLFAQARDNGMTHVIMEVSSHALDQERVAGIDFNAAAFTNLTQDHLDYHPDLDSYRSAKLKLFERITDSDGFTVVFGKDPSAEHFIRASKVRCYTYGKKGEWRATKIEAGLRKTAFRLKSPLGEADVSIKLIGNHNVLNALCAAAICGGLGLSLDAITDGLAAMDRVPGRFEPVDCGQKFQVIVDYAHTEDGLRNVLKAARKLKPRRLITVFGCGGDRDKGKRPKMGAAAGDLSDFCILTSDNPRTEDPYRILLDVEVGLQKAERQKDRDYLVIADRRAAIRQAAAMARPGDLVMIAGKGHEDYQIIGEGRIHFDDREEARFALEALQS
jgi:UDP-N-acetylmuramoyl-L-alanyl-D-glutamate--2,6-diaminopimelate ligase